VTSDRRDPQQAPYDHFINGTSAPYNKQTLNIQAHGAGGNSEAHVLDFNCRKSLDIDMLSKSDSH